MVWKFAENKEGAQQFLIDYIDAFPQVFAASKWYDFPAFPATLPDLQKIISNDADAQPPDKYKVLGNALEWSTNIGHPGFATPVIDEAFRTWLLPTMFAKVARGQETAESAARMAEQEYQRIAERWR